MNWIFFEHYSHDSNITLFFHSTLKIRHEQQKLHYYNIHHGTNYKISTHTCGWFTILYGVINIYLFLFGCIMNYSTTSSGNKLEATATTSSNVIKKRTTYGNVSIILSWIGFMIIFLGEFGLIGTHSILYSSIDNYVNRQRNMQWDIFDWIWITFSVSVTIFSISSIN